MLLPRSLAVQHVFENVLVKKIKLRLVSKEAGFVHGEVFHQLGQLLLAFFRNQQAIVAVEGIQVALA